MLAQSRLEPVLPLSMDPETLEEIIDKAKDWALMHGACMRSKTSFSKDNLYFAPFALLPSRFPKQEFERAVNIQPIINELIHKVAHNHEFLEDTLKYTVEVDEFTGRLYKLYDKVRQEGLAQCAMLGLIRSDYIQHIHDGNRIKQVEANTIASSFGGIGTHIVTMQRFVLQELGHPEMLENLAENNALEGLCSGMLEAWKIFGNKNAVIMFIIENVTYNICDQRFHEFEIRRLNPSVRVIRRTLTQIANTGKLGPNKELLIGKDTVAVVYFRAGYEPGHYPTEREWDARLMMERSTAIKCPTIHYHLAGTKKVQQALARPNALEKFLDDPEKIEAIRDVFTGLYSFDFDEFGDAAVEMAMKTPERFVLKPQREGGGNNVYGVEIRDAVMKMKDSKERSAWILMDRITPPLQANYMVRPGQEVKEPVDLVSELGIFGVIIGDAKTILSNKQVGHMLRSKLSSANEGGVAAGAGALDSPYLVL